MCSLDAKRVATDCGYYRTFLGDHLSDNVFGNLRVGIGHAWNAVFNSTAELDANVEPTLGDRNDDRDREEDCRDDVPDFASADKVDGALTGVETVSEVTEL